MAPPHPRIKWCHALSIRFEQLHKGNGINSVIEEQNKVTLVRKALADLDVVGATEMLLEKMKKTKTNEEFLARLSEL